MQARPSKHCLYIIYARKIYVHTLVKITRQWKSTPSVLSQGRLQYLTQTPVHNYLVEKEYNVSRYHTTVLPQSTQLSL